MSLSDSSSEVSHGYMDQLRLPMLAIPFKQGASVDLISPLAELIRNQFGEDPAQFRQEVREFNQLRELAIRPSRDNNGTSVIRRYYAQLSLLPTRFAATRSAMQVRHLATLFPHLLIAKHSALYSHWLLGSFPKNNIIPI